MTDSTCISTVIKEYICDNVCSELNKHISDGAHRIIINEEKPDEITIGVKKYDLSSENPDFANALIEILLYEYEAVKNDKIEFNVTDCLLIMLEEKKYDCGNTITSIDVLIELSSVLAISYIYGCFYYDITLIDTTNTIFKNLLIETDKSKYTSGCPDTIDDIIFSTYSGLQTHGLNLCKMFLKHGDIYADLLDYIKDDEIIKHKRGIKLKDSIYKNAVINAIYLMDVEKLKELKNGYGKRFILELDEEDKNIIPRLIMNAAINKKSIKDIDDTLKTVEGMGFNTNIKESPITLKSISVMFQKDTIYLLDLYTDRENTVFYKSVKNDIYKSVTLKSKAQNKKWLYEPINDCFFSNFEQIFGKDALEECFKELPKEILQDYCCIAIPRDCCVFFDTPFLNIGLSDEDQVLLKNAIHVKNISKTDGVL